MILNDLTDAIPGLKASLTTDETNPTWGTVDFNLGGVIPVVIDGAARDSGHTGNTTTLRPGLLIGINRTTKKAKEWTSGASDGTQVVAGILLKAVLTQQDNANADRLGWVMIQGRVKASKMIVPGSVNPGLDGNASEAAIRTACGDRLLLDDRFFD